MKQNKASGTWQPWDFSRSCLSTFLFALRGSRHPCPWSRWAPLQPLPRKPDSSGLALLEDRAVSPQEQGVSRITINEGSRLCRVSGLSRVNRKQVEVRIRGQDSSRSSETRDLSAAAAQRVKRGQGLVKNPSAPQRPGHLSPPSAAQPPCCFTEDVRSACPPAFNPRGL